MTPKQYTDGVKPGTVMRRLILTVFLVFLTAPVVRAEMVSVNGDGVNMRSGPSTGNAVLWELGRGFPLQVLVRKGEWLKVADFEGDEGWIHESVVSRKPHLVVKVKGNPGQRVNVRSGPGTNYRVVGQANHGVVFETLEQSKGWAKVRHEKGLTGWVKRNLLWGW